MNRYNPFENGAFTPTDVRTVACPYCGAEPEAQCIGVRGLRKSNHRERVKKYHYSR